ncbi:MAG: Type 1 glutamine amidotransferase-like domain-containing protein [Treponema sp.]|nr:Type 1 glutamine amidotransferase-like domain-containing protein [Treponema sp.]
MNQNKEIPAMLLAGGMHSKARSIARMVSQALNGMQKPQVAYIGTANGDSLLFFHLMKSILKKAGAGKTVFLRLAKEKPDLEAARNILKNSDAVFLAGGEVEDGMHWLKKHGLVDFLKELYKQGKRFIGISAGVIMMGSRWVHWDVEGDDSTSKLFDCLGIIPAIFDVHGENEEWAELKTALKLSGNGTRGYALPAGCMISAGSQGTLVNLEKEYMVFVNEGGCIHVL